MPSSTPLRSRPYPLSTDSPTVHADIQALATNLDQVPNLNTGTTLPGSGVAGDEFQITTSGAWYKHNGTAWRPLGGLNQVVVGVSSTALPGQLVEATGTITVTLPSPAVPGQTVGIRNAASGVVTVTTPSGVVEGVGLIAATFTLGATNAAVLLVSDGTNWLMMSGQQDTGWVALTLTSGWTPNTRAPAVRLVGDRVWLKGIAIPGSTTSVTTVPTFAKPTDTTVFLNTMYAYTTIQTSGALQFNTTANQCQLDGMSYTLS